MGAPRDDYAAGLSFGCEARPGKDATELDERRRAVWLSTSPGDLPVTLECTPARRHHWNTSLAGSHTDGN